MPSRDQAPIFVRKLESEEKDFFVDLNFKLLLFFFFFFFFPCHPFIPKVLPFRPCSHEMTVRGGGKAVYSFSRGVFALCRHGMR